MDRPDVPSPLAQQMFATGRQPRQLGGPHPERRQNASSEADFSFSIDSLPRERLPLVYVGLVMAFFFGVAWMLLAGENSYGCSRRCGSSQAAGIGFALFGVGALWMCVREVRCRLRNE